MCVAPTPDTQACADGGRSARSLVAPRNTNRTAAKGDDGEEVDEVQLQTPQNIAVAHNSEQPRMAAPAPVARPGSDRLRRPLPCFPRIWCVASWMPAQDRVLPLH